MIEIIFEPHATSYDNEAHLASGHNDVDLSELGVKQAKDLGQRRGGEHFDAVFTSDLKRAYRTAELAFGKKFPVYQDKHLRECDYGQHQQRPSETVEADRINRLSQPFPGGESYEQCAERMRAFLDELLAKHDGQRVLIIGHRATQYGLERWILGKPLAEIVTAPWQWQPGWVYHLEKLKN